jgi:hypothetical protein
VGNHRQHALPTLVYVHEDQHLHALPTPDRARITQTPIYDLLYDLCRMRDLDRMYHRYLKLLSPHCEALRPEHSGIVSECDSKPVRRSEYRLCHYRYHPSCSSDSNHLEIAGIRSPQSWTAVHSLRWSCVCRLRFAENLLTKHQGHRYSHCARHYFISPVQ